jgi:hypothetical protein
MAPRAPRAVFSTATSIRSHLSGFFVLSIHRHALTRQDVCQGTLVAKFAIAFDIPSAGLSLGARLLQVVGEWTR